LLGELVDEDRPLRMRRLPSEDIGDGRREVVTDVDGEELEHLRPVAGRHEGIEREAHDIALRVVRGEAEPQQFIEQAARVHVLRDAARERLEAAPFALPCQRARAAAAVPPFRRGAPAREDGRGERARGQGLVGRAREPRDFAPVDARGGADAAHQAVRQAGGMSLARGLHHRLLQALLGDRERHAPRDEQARERHQQRLHGCGQGLLLVARVQGGGSVGAAERPTGAAGAPS
jgi:hypothetical protein